MIQTQSKFSNSGTSNKQFIKSNRPTTTNNFRVSIGKETRFYDSPQAVRTNYSKTRSLQVVSNEKNEKLDKTPENSKKWLSRPYFCFDSIKSQSKEDQNSQIYVLLSIFKERPGCILFNYPSFCSLESRLTPLCRPLTLDQVSKYSPKYKFTKKTPIYNCILKSLEFAGLERTESKLKCNLLLSALPKNKSLKYLHKFQKYNHFPGSWHLGRKDNLWRNIWKKRREFNEEYNFCPNTYIMPDDFRLFQQDREDNPKELWIYKPVASSCGRGIKMISGTSVVEKRGGYLISRYISNPHTINGLKYDLRIYVLATSFDPLRIYMYQEGLVRFATQHYSIDAKSLKTRYIHLTNYSVNKKAANYMANQGKPKDQSADKFSYKWPLSALKEEFVSLGIDYDLVFGRVKDLVVKTMISVEAEIVSKVLSLTRFRGNCFELYGFDILLDSNLKPWLLEVNVAPSLSSGSILDKQIKTSLMCDVFTLVGIIPVDRTSLKKEEKKLRHNLNPRTKFKNYSAIMNSKELGELNDEEVRIIAENQEEMQRLGRFERVFPLKENFEKYESFFDVKRLNNAITWISMSSEDDVLAQYLSRLEPSI